MIHTYTRFFIGLLIISIACNPLIPAMADLQSDRVNGFRNSFTYWALESQRRMAMDEPISNVMYIESHNSFNSLRDSNFHIVPASGPNQILSITQQLDIGARGIELDVHNLRNLELEICITDNPATIAQKILDAIENIFETENQVQLFAVNPATGELCDRICEAGPNGEVMAIDPASGEVLAFFGIGDIFDAIGDFFGDIADEFGDIFDGTFDLFEDVAGAFGDLFGDIGQFISDLEDLNIGCGTISICFPPTTTAGVPQLCTIPGGNDLFLGHEGEGDFGSLGGIPVPVNGIRPYEKGIQEVANWIRNHPDEIILIDLEDATSGRKNELLAPILQYWVDDDGQSLVFTPGDRVAYFAGRWPSRRELLEIGKQIVIFDSRDNSFEPYTLNYTSATDPFHEWAGSQYTFLRKSNRFGIIGGNWDETGIGNFDPASALAVADDIEQFFSVTGDGLTFVVADVGNRAIQPADVDEMVRLNVNIFKMDFLLGGSVPSLQVFNFDLPEGPVGERLRRMVWSWEEGDSSVFRARGDMDNILAERDYGIQLPNSNRWRSVNTSGTMTAPSSDAEMCFACVSSEPIENVFGKPLYLWRITEGKGKWYEGNEFCKEEFGAVEFPGIPETIRFVYGAPVNPHRNEMLYMERRDTGRLNEPVWLNVEDSDEDGDWTVNLSPVASILPVNQPPPKGGGLNDIINPGVFEVSEGTEIIGFGDERQGIVEILNPDTNAILFTGRASFDPDVLRDTLNHMWTWEFDDPKNQSISPSSGSVGEASASPAFPDDGITALELQVLDGHPAGMDFETANIIVNNVNPVAVVTSLKDETGSGIGEKIPVALEGLELTLSGTFSDAGSYDTHTAAIEWGDGTTTQPAGLDSFTDTVSGENGQVSARHVFDVAGLYTIALNVTDDDNGVGTGTTEIEVVSAGRAAQIASELVAELAISGTSDETAASYLEQASSLLNGNVDGAASNGVFDHFEGGRYNAGFIMLGEALSLLSEAANLDPALAEDSDYVAAKCLLALSGKSAVVKRLELADTNRGNAEDRIAEAQALIAAGDAYRELGKLALANQLYEEAQRIIQGLTNGR